MAFLPESEMNTRAESGSVATSFRKTGAGTAVRLTIVFVGMSISANCVLSTTKSLSPRTASPVGLLSPGIQAGSRVFPSRPIRAIAWRPCPRLGVVGS